LSLSIITYIHNKNAINFIYDKTYLFYLRILYIHDYYYSITGSSIANRNLCKILLNKGIDVRIISSSPSVIKKTTQNIYFLPSAISKWPISISLPLPDKIIHIIKTMKPDIIHLQCLSPLSLMVLFVARKYNIPVVAGIHDLPRNISIYFPKISRFINYFTKFILPKFFNKVNVCIAPSLFAKRYYHNLGVTNEIQIISNGIKLENFTPSSANTIFYRKILNNGNNIKKILYVGRIMPDKDLDVLVNAMQKIDDAIAIIIGPFWKGYLKKLKKLDHRKKIIFLGHVPFNDLLRFYHTCDLFIQPCTSELQGIAILEAMASRLPVIGANSGATPELIANGINGLLFSPNDAIDLKNKIDLIIHDDKLRKQMICLSYEKILPHSIYKTANDYIKLYYNYINK